MTGWEEGEGEWTGSLCSDGAVSAASPSSKWPSYVLFLVHSLLQITALALAGVAQWTERLTAKQRVASSIPSQGTCLGCRPGPHCRVLERQMHIDVSFPLFLRPFSSIKINKILKIKKVL